MRIGCEHSFNLLETDLNLITLYVNDGDVFDLEFCDPCFEIANNHAKESGAYLVSTDIGKS